MQMGSVSGHGSYVASDWMADWLHREALFVLAAWSRAKHGLAWDDLDRERRAALIALDHATRFELAPQA